MSKRDNFVRIATKRVNQIIDQIESLQNLTNKSYYDFDKKDIDKIYNAINLANEQTYNILLNKKGNEFKL